MYRNKVRSYGHRAAAMVVGLSLCSGCVSKKHIDWDCRRAQFIVADVDRIYSDIELPNRPLTFDDVIAVAMQRNMSLEVKKQEYRIQQEAITRERYRMLPQVRGSFEFSGRTENTASFSQSLIPGVPPAPLSISSEQHTARWEASAVFNLLDFGLSYYRYQQEENKLLIAQLEYEKLQQNLIVDIMRQYWKTIIAEHAVKRSKVVVEKTLEQQATIERQMNERLISEIQGLRNQNILLTILQQLLAYEKEYHNAKTELSLLMGLPPDIEYELAAIDQYNITAIIDEIEELETMALNRRPELRNADVEQEIRSSEVRTALMQLLPGVELFGGPSHDSNSFLLHNNWLSAGLRAIWNLLDAPGIMQEKRVAQERLELAKRNRLALSIGVISQVYLAYIVYQDNMEAYILSKEIETVNRRMFNAAQSEHRQGKIHEADILRYQADALFTEVAALKAYGELQNSLEHLNNAMGCPLHYQNAYTYQTVEELEEEIEIDEISAITWSNSEGDR